MNAFIKSRDSAGSTLLHRSVRNLLSVAMLMLMVATLNSALAQNNDRQEQRAAIQQANRERWMQRQQEMQEQNAQRESLQWQRRNRLGIPQQFEPGPPGFSPGGAGEDWRDRRQGRMTPEERQALRRQIQEAGRSVYSAPPPNR